MSTTHFNEVQLPSIPGYILTKAIYVGRVTAVYRALVEADTQGRSVAHSVATRSVATRSVVIKVLQSHTPSIQDLVRFRNQYIIAKSLTSPGIVKPLALESWQGRYALVMEDVGGVALREYLQSCGHLSVQAVLETALQMADILHHLSQHRVLHKDIKPANILIHPDTHQIWLTDFSLASLLPKESQSLQSPRSLEGTLAYMAPEQTGRMNRGIDYRADFYSLGITLYELLTGELPFQSETPMELIHCHIAKTPPNLSSSIPRPVSDIVLKLMAKNAEDRYQSALGLKHDLQRCLSQWKTSGKIESFQLGQQDHCDRFLIQEKLYGREPEVHMLMAAFERVAQGASELVLVAGYSGVGKTAVVNEIHKPITRKKGYFIKGKFDQLNRNIPFSGFVQALRHLMEQLLSESDTALADWQTKILAAIGQQGQVLIDVIPELALIIGPQPQVPELSGMAAKNRFNRLFGLFVQVFTTPEHPLVIFLDDLQWIDVASLALLKLLTGAETDYLLVLGAYRDNEVSPVHPLTLMLEELEQQKTTISTINLAPLSMGHINQLVAETLNCELALATPLMEVIYQKTGGNPFFTVQFLKGLHEDELITFDPDFGGWECDLVKVRESALTDDVVEFMVQRLYRLPLATQNILKLAACIGNQFDLATLAIISETSLAEVANNLWEALQSGLILPQSDAYKFFQGEQAQHQPVAVSYHFLHDRVQQGAYALIADDQKQTTHLTIGRLLLQKFSSEDREKNLFKIVNQLNMGSALIELPRELEELAQLNLMAAQKAKSAAAYGASANYLMTAIELLHTETLSTEPWHTHYELMLPLHNLLAEVSYLNGEYAASQQQTQTIIANAQGLLDQVKAYEIRILLSIAQGQCQRALDIGLEILSLLDVSFDDAPLPDIDIDRLYQLPTITSSKIIAALSILSKLWAPALIAGSDLLPQVILTMLNLSATHGNSAVAAFAYSLYGMLLCAKITDIELGYRFGQLALHTLERYEDAELTCKVNQLFHAFIRNWKELARDHVECLADNVLTGLETGDIEFACYASINYCDNLFLIGEPLNIIHKKQTYYIELAKSLQQPMQHATLCSWGQMVDNLMGMADEPTQLIGNRFDESVQIPKLQESGVGSTLFFIYTSKTILNYLFNDYEQTLIDAQMAIAYEQAGEGMLPITQISLYRSLGLLALYPTFDLDRQAQSLDEVETHLQRLRIWATHAPMNHQHKVDLIEAEKCRVLGHKLEALERYDQAIAGAQANGYLQEQAIANERAAQFYLDWGKANIAAVYMQEAYSCYDLWGAKAKTKAMLACYADLLQPVRQQSQAIDPLTTLHQSAPMPLSIHEPVSSAQNATWGINSSFDLAAILKSARALSESIDLNELLVKLAPMMLQTAGAERLMLLLPDADKVWQVRVTANADATQLVSEPLLENPHLPVQLIHYVQRLQKIVVVDGRNPSLPVIEPYLEQHPHRSVLCFPLLHQSKLVGLLYLDHRSIADVFSRDRITILNFLCTQAAISLENALLNQALAQKLEIQTIKREESEERLQQIALNVPGLIYQVAISVEGQLTVLYTSRDYCEAIYEVSAEAMMTGQYNFRDFEHPEDKPVLDQLLADCNRTWKTLDHQFRIITPSGTLKWLHVISHPVRRIVDESQSVTATVWDGVMMDVSDRKAAELALQETQTQLHRLTENIPGMVFRYVLHPDNSHEFTYVSSYISELYEMTSEEVMQKEKSPWDIVHPDDVDYLASKIQESAQTLQPINVEHRFILPQKGLRWGQNIGRPEQQDNGDIVWQGVSFDITNRKTTEFALQEAQTQFRRITENVPGMIYRYVLHPDGNDELTYVNSQVREIYEVEPEIALQDMAQVWARIHPDDVDRIQELAQESAKTLQPFDVEYRVLLPQKGLRWVQVGCCVERLDNGDVMWDGIVMDITDRKAAEQQLQALSERLELAIASAHIGIWEWNFQDNCLSWDGHMFEIYGISPETFEGTHQDWEKCVHPDDFEQAQSQEDDEYPVSKEFRIIQPDGSIRYVVSTTLLQYDNQGQPLRAVGTNIDISDRKQAERLLADYNQELEQQVQERTRSLQKSEATLLKAQQVAHVGNWEFDVSSQTITWSPEMFRIYGIEPAASAPSYPEFLQLLSGRTRQQIEHYVERAVTEGIPFIFEYSRTLADGTVRHQECRTEIERNAEGQVAHLLGTVLDITDRKQSELALQNLVAGTAATIGEDFFPALVQHISAALDVPLALVTQFVDQELQSLAFIVDGELQPNFTYHLPDTPCRDLVVDYTFYCPSNLTEHFPNHPHRARDVDSYLGVALRDRQGQVLGSLCIFDRQPLQDPERARQILDVFGSRAVAELERQRTEKALENLIAGTAVTTRADFFPVLVRYLTEALGVSHAIMAERVGNDEITLAYFGDGELLPTQSFSFLNTPCEEVYERGAYYCEFEPSQTTCAELNKMEARSYLGVSLNDRQGNAIGLLSIFHRQYLSDPVRAAQILQVFAARAATELERQRAENALQNLIAGTAALTGPDFFPALVHHIATALNASHAFVTEIVDDGARPYFWAAWADGEQLPNETIDTAGTTCLIALEQGVYHCERDVIARFPENPRLAPMGVESYMGVALKNPAGETIGTLCIFARQPIADPEQAEQMLRVFGARAAAEMERLRVSTALEQLNQQLEQRVAQRTRELASSEKDLRTIFNNVHDAIYIHDLDGSILDMNARSLEQLGATREQILASTIAEISAPDVSIERISDLFERASAGKELRFEWKKKRLSDGVVFDVEVFLKKVVLGNQSVIVAGMRDISDRKQAQLALEQEVLRRNTIFNTSSDGIHILDVEGNLIEANTRFFQMLGYTPEEGQHLQVFDWDIKIPPEVIRKDFAAAATLQTSWLKTVETLHQRKDGAIFPVEVSVCPMPWDGDVSIMCIARDISERKQAEAELQQTNAQLVRATQLKDEFLANMSHELRTPLNSILGLSEALQDSIFGSLSDQQLKYLKIIESSGTHLLALINDILDVAKIESGQIELDLKPTDIGRLCESSLAFIKQQALKKHISLTITFPPHTLTLHIDERRILQSLVNLLNNAVKFTPNGGSITLEVSRHQQDEELQLLDHQTPSNNIKNPNKLVWESDVLTASSYIKISVIDTGVGIAPESITKLFKPFSQIDGTLNRKYSGTGLGLVLVKQMVELHGGTVSLTSEVEVGSCFSINLPYNAVSPVVDQSASSPGTIHQPSLPTGVEPGDSQLILLAEDNEDTISFILPFLEHCGYRLVVARDGQEAIELAQTHCPDLILMDIQMPEVSGVEAMQCIRQVSALQETPIIALTALAMAGDQEQCLEAGANLYLSKPVKLKQLVSSIRSLLP